MFLSQPVQSQAELEQFTCPVTLPSSDKSTWYDQHYSHHNDVLGVILYPTGTRTIGQPGAWLQEDGYIHSKFPWLKKVAGKLTIKGQQLDGEPSRPFKARIQDPNEREGGKPGGFLFPNPGCWKITGILANQELSFVFKIIDPN